MIATHPQRIIDAHCHIGEIPPWKFYDLEHPVKPTVYDYRSTAEFVKNHMDEFKIERALAMSNYGVPVHEISFDLNDVVMDAATTNDRILAAIWVSFLPRNAEMTRKALKLAGESRVVALKTTFLLGGNPDPGSWDEETKALADECFDACEKHDLDLPLPHEPGRQLGHLELHPARRGLRQALQDLPRALRRRGVGPHPPRAQVPAVGAGRLQGLHGHLVGDRLRRALAADRDRAARASAATASSSAPTSRGRTSTASTGRSTASAASPRSSRSGSSGATTRSCSPAVAEHATVALDDRRLVVELQSLGVRVEDETGGGVQGRRGGAGPSDAGFLWVRGLPLTVPMHAEYAQRSPYTLRIGERGARLELAGEYVAPVVVPPRPQHLRHADGRRRARTGRSRCCTSTRSPRPSCRSASTGTRPSSAPSAASS